MLNTRFTLYPDGGILGMVALDTPYDLGCPPCPPNPVDDIAILEGMDYSYSEALDILSERQHRADADRREYRERRRVERTPAEIARKKGQAIARAKSAVYDIARCNTWNWLITLTVSEDTCNRYDYDECYKYFSKVLKDLRRYHGVTYLAIPEQHKDGAWHLHALVGGDLPHKLALHPRTGRILRAKKSGAILYNILGVSGGWTTASKLDGSPKVARYVTKYMSKDSGGTAIPEGRKRYLCSLGLQRPVVAYAYVDVDSPLEDDSCCINAFLSRARFSKIIHTNDYGDYLLFELDSAEGQVLPLLDWYTKREKYNKFCTRKEIWT